MPARALGLLAGYLADRRWGDPRNHHPVAGFGRVANGLEHRMWVDDRRAGVAYAAALVGGTALVGSVLERLGRRSAILRFLVTASSTWAVLGGRSLIAESNAVRVLLQAEDLDSARARLTHLVGRDTVNLTEPEVARAVIESVAENTSDAVVAPLLAGAVAGVPGLFAYRAANTLDAMVGHRSARHENFGWASARLDDILNWLPARIGAALAVVLAPTVGGQPSAALRVWKRDAGAHPSPNAGQIEAAFAGALDVRLGGVNSYGGAVEDRHALGDGREPSASDIEAANHLSAMVGGGALLLAMTLSRRRRRRPTPRRQTGR